jgi:hypothetical protein
VYEGIPKSVLITAAEDSWEHTIVPRLMAAEADLTRVFRIDVSTRDGKSASLEVPADLNELRRVILESQAALVLLDPLLSRLGGNLDTHKDADVRQALEPLVAVADQTDTAVIGLIHVNKSVTTDPLTMLMASRAFVAVARSVVFVMIDPQDKDKRLLGFAKNNLGRLDLPTRSFSIAGVPVAETPEGTVWTARINWLGDVDQTLNDAIEASSGTSDDRTAVADATDWLREYLEAADGPSESLKVKRAGHQAGHTLRTLQRALKQLKPAVTRVGFPSRTYWAPPVQTVAPNDDDEDLANF